MVPPHKPTESTTPTTLSGALLDHLLASAGKARHVGPTRFAVAGYGPFSEEEIMRALFARERAPYFAEISVGAIIVGREDWKRGLDESLHAHSGQELKVYTHEMLLTLLLTREDPYAYGVNHVRALYGDHPALRYLDEPQHFDWPTLRVPDDSDLLTADHALEFDHLQAEGVLKAFKYQVGFDGHHYMTRRRALERSFLDPAPVDAPDFIRERLAEAGTPSRLRQVAYAIAAQWRLATGRRSANMSRALEHWEKDLAWLKTTYYDKLDPPDFQWPDLPER